MNGPHRRARGQAPLADLFIDDAEWITTGSLRPTEIEALAERFSNRPFQELLNDREFKRLSDPDVRALAAEFRRRAVRTRAQTDADARGPARSGGLFRRRSS
jgi:hypothetical protein